MQSNHQPPPPSFEEQSRALLANARRDHPMLSPEMRRWIEEACRRLGVTVG